MHATTSSGSTRLAPALAWILSVCLGLASVSSWADDPDPASRVARISYLKGPVYVQTGDDNAWNDASINRPLTSGDQLWTDAQGRSELQMGSTTVQVDANTQLRLSKLSDDELQLVVTQGVVNVRVRSLGDNDSVEVDTPNATVAPVEPGTYRIEVAEHDDLTIVQVRDGEAHIAGEKQDFTLRQDKQLSLRGSKRLTADFDELARMDEFDRWARDRNDRAERVTSSRYVAADLIGYEDLDDYGYWRWYSGYGYVWMPTHISIGWAPYRYGHWFWVSPWGWTWIDDAPWGFAPFHYGRWAMLDRRWCWVPGPRTARAIYAPALVAWVGTPGVSVSINIGHQPVGWIPLGPREVYRPYYRGSYVYVTRVNLSNSLLSSNEFERGYRRQPHDNDYHNRNATSVVQADTLREARPVHNQLIRPGHTQLQPLTTQPVARPDRNEAGNRARQWSPPLTPNTREVLTRRQFGTRDESNRDGARSDGNINKSGPDKFGGVRENDPSLWRRNREANDTVGAGRGIDSRNDNHASDDHDRGLPRNQAWGRNRDDAPVDHSSRSIAPAPVPPEVTQPQRHDRSRDTPATDAAPAPRVRNQPWVRDEMQLDRRESSGVPNERHAAPMDRERMNVPNNPAPMQAPAAPPEAIRPQHDRDDNDHRGRHRDRDDR